MARVIISLGGRRSDYPCGESVAGPTWLAVCFNADWKDWWLTAVNVRTKVIDAGKQGFTAPGAGAWLKDWVEEDAPLAASALAMNDPRFEGSAARWNEDPGAIWSKGRLKALVAYVVQGANILESATGNDSYFRDVTEDDATRGLKPLAVGLALGAAAVVGAVLYFK